MNELLPCYEVNVPLRGSAGTYYTVVRANSPEGAGEVVRVLLECGDKEMTEVRIVVGVRISQE